MLAGRTDSTAQPSLPLGACPGIGPYHWPCPVPTSVILIENVQSQHPYVKILPPPFKNQSPFVHRASIINFPQQEIVLSNPPQHEWHLCSAHRVLIINVVFCSFLSEYRTSPGKVYLLQRPLCGMIANTGVWTQHVLKIHIRWALSKNYNNREVTS